MIVHLVISAAWVLAIAEFAAAQRAAGASPSTVRSRTQHLQQFARAVPIQPWAVTTENLLSWAGGIMWAPETRRGRYDSYRVFRAWGKVTKRRRKDAGKRLPTVRAGDANPRPAPERLSQRALSHAAPRERLWMELAHDHGLRRGKVAEIRSDDIFEDLVGHSLIVARQGREGSHHPPHPALRPRAPRPGIRLGVPLR